MHEQNTNGTLTHMVQNISMKSGYVANVCGRKSNPRYVELLRDGQVGCIVLPFTADGTAGIAPSFICVPAKIKWA